MTEQALPAAPFPGERGPGTPASTSEEVRRILARQIAAGELRPGQRLGAERELAAEMGAPVVTTHPGAIPEDRSAPEYQILLRAITEIARHGERCGGLFCIETGQETAEVLRAFLETIGSPHLKVNYDPANMLRHGPVEGVKTLAPWIVHTHAKDLDPETHKATLGQGRVPWREYLAALKAIGYDGWSAIEDETGKDVVNSLKQGRQFLEAALAER